MGVVVRSPRLDAAAGGEVHVISGIAGKGLPELLHALVKAMDAPAKEKLAQDEAAEVAGWQP